MQAPDKQLRAWVYSKLNGMTISGKNIPVADSRIPSNSDAYVLMTTIDKSLPQETKCGRVWNATLTLDLVTVYVGNNGSRAYVESIQDEVLTRLINPTINGFTVQDYYVDFGPDLSIVQTEQSVFRKIIILTFKLK